MIHFQTQLGVSCKEHLDFLPACEVCRKLKEIEDRWSKLREGRSWILAELTKVLTEGKAIIREVK